jgi:hypothetical protein
MMATMMVAMIVMTAAPAMASNDCDNGWWIWSVWSGWLYVCQ